MKLILLSAILFLSQASFAQGSDEYVCDFKGVRTVKTKLYAEKLNYQTFDFRYQVVGDIRPDELVIIHLPGGPGANSIKDYDDPIEREKIRNNAALPESVPWIMIDPRTVGCNRGDENLIPSDSLTSENLALDILSVVEDLHLTKYIVYGHSYGSQSATFVAGLAASRGLPAPHAVVLSGVLGFGKEDGSFSIPSQKILEWNNIKNKLSAKVRSKLETDKPLGLENYRWRKWITGGLYDGYYIVKGEFKNKLIEKLQLLESDDPLVYAPLIEAVNPPTTSSPVNVRSSDFSDRLFNKVDCHEYSPHDGGSNFENGQFIFDPEDDPCDGEAFDRRYDSSAFNMNTHIYYLSGTNDIAAPYEGARYHFENQAGSRRNFMTIPGGGHGMYGWLFPDCMDKVWDKILQQEDLTDVLPGCKAPVKLEIK